MWRQQLEDKYTVKCKKCKKELIDISKKPNQKYYKGTCPHCGYVYPKYIHDGSKYENRG